MNYQKMVYQMFGVLAAYLKERNLTILRIKF